MNAKILSNPPFVVTAAPAGNGANKVTAALIPPRMVAPVLRRFDSDLLALGAGGAGIEALTHLKALLMDAAGRLPVNVALRAYDSADESYAVADPRFSQPVMLEKGAERKHLGGMPIGRIKEAPERHKKLLARIGQPGLRAIRRPIIDGGAGQSRPEGLATFAWAYQAIMTDLLATIRGLRRRAQNVDDSGLGNQALTALLFGSICGGQGSATLMELGVAVRTAAAQLGLADQLRVVAFMFLPDAFPEARGPNMAANAWATLCEWDVPNQGETFEATYTGGTRVRWTGPVADQQFVVGGIDENGRMTGSREEAIALGAKAAAVMVSSGVGLRAQLNAINETGVLDGISPDGHRTCLATVGHAAIAFHAARIAEWCAVRQALAVIDRLLAAQEGPAPVGLPGAAGLAERISVSASGAPLTVEFAAPTTLLSAPIEDAPTMARTLVSNGLKHRVFEAGYAQINENATAAGVALTAEVRNWSAGVTANGRLGSGLDDLERLEADLARQAAAASREAERLATLGEEAQAGLDAASAALSTAADSNVFVRRGQVRNAVAAYLAQGSVVANARLAQRTAQLTAAILGEALKQVRQELTAVQTSAARLASAGANLQARRVELAAPLSGHSEIDLGTPELREQLYAQYAVDAASLVGVAVDELGPTAAWQRFAAEELAARLTQVASRPFFEVAQLNVEQVLQRNWTERSAGHWIARLRELAAGAWNLDRALLPGGGDSLAQLMTIGVPDAATSLFANAGLTLVSTHDAERIVALRTVYGAAFEALQSAGQWRAAYEATADRARLHVFPGMKVE